jgi:hypothetical protein
VTVFELVGLPGAGKTTLAQRLLDWMAARGAACGERELVGRLGRSRAAHFARLAGFTARKGRYIPATFQLATSVRPPSVSRARFAAKLAVWPYRLSVARAKGFQTVVLDQGILQSAWCVLLEGSLRQPRALDRAVGDVLSACEANFAFISLDLDAELAAARIQARGPMAPPFHRSNPETIRLLTEHRDHLEDVIAAGVRATGAPHLRLDGRSPLTENARRIETFAESICYGTPGSPPSSSLAQGVKVSE